jgi:hypothetical protein
MMDTTRWLGLLLLSPLHLACTITVSEKAFEDDSDPFGFAAEEEVRDRPGSVDATRPPLTAQDDTEITPASEDRPEPGLGPVRDDGASQEPRPAPPSVTAPEEASETPELVPPQTPRDPEQDSLWCSQQLDPEPEDECDACTYTRCCSERAACDDNMECVLAWNALRTCIDEKNPLEDPSISPTADLAECQADVVANLAEPVPFEDLANCVAAPYGEDAMALSEIFQGEGLCSGACYNIDLLYTEEDW